MVAERIPQELPQTQIHIVEPRNSGARKVTERVFGPVAKFGIDIYPDLNPNHITIAGVAAVLAGGALIEYANLNDPTNKRKLLITGTTLQVFGYSSDGLDGAVAKEKVARDPFSHDTTSGMLWDVGADRAREIGSGLARAVVAYYQQDLFAEMAAYANVSTTVKPSLERARQEKDGWVVPETGINLPGKIGSTPSRMFITTAASLLRSNRIAGLSVPGILDATGAVCNLYLAEERKNGVGKTALTASKDGLKSREDIITEAELRSDLLEKFDRAAPVAALITATTLRIIGKAAYLEPHGVDLGVPALVGLAIKSE